MKIGKVKVLVALTLMMCFIVVTSVSATTYCPNCASTDVDQWYWTHDVGGPVYCTSICYKQLVRVDQMYGCNSCRYNWGVPINSFYTHSDPYCPND